MLDNFTQIIFSILPLYFFILLGFFAGKKLHVKREGIATLLIYVIAPAVVFHGLVTRPFTVSVLLVPALLFVLATMISMSFAFLTRSLWKDATTNLLAFAVGTGNTGYFGLPVALILFGEEAYPIAVMGVLATIVFEVTVGFYFTARGNYTPAESLRRLMRLPALYAFLLGLFCAYNNYTPSATILKLLDYFKSSYTLLGMMVIGLALSAVKRADIDKTFIIIIQCVRYILWPVVISLILLVDQSYLHFFDLITMKALFLIGFLPMAANTVVFATELRVMPEKAATAVFISTLIAFFILPFVPTLFDLLFVR